MRRTMLAACAAVAALAITAVSATAAVTKFDLGSDSEQFVVLNDNNKPAQQGPRVAYIADIKCTAGERAGVIAVATQESNGADGQGGGRSECTGDKEKTLIVLQKNQGSSNFSFEDDLFTEGVAATDTRTRQLNDLRYNHSTLSPFDLSSLPGLIENR